MYVHITHVCRSSAIDPNSSRCPHGRLATFPALCMYVCMYVCIHMCVYTYTYMHLTCVYICTYMHLTQIYIHIYIYIYIYQHTAPDAPIGVMPPSQPFVCMYVCMQSVCALSQTNMFICVKYICTHMQVSPFLRLWPRCAHWCTHVYIHRYIHTHIHTCVTHLSFACGLVVHTDAPPW
jgi:hypothetical protein